MKEKGYNLSGGGGYKVLRVKFGRASLGFCDGLKRVETGFYKRK